MTTPASAPAAPAATVGTAPAAPAAAPAAATPAPASAPLDINPAAAPAPATPAAPTVPATPAAGAPAPVEYEPTGNPGFDLFLGFIGKSGYGPEHPAVVAAESGDFSLLKAELALKGEKGWEQVVALGEREVASKAEANKAKVAADTAAIEAAVGGAEQWAAIQSWAAQNAEPAERAAVNQALAAGGIAAKAMAMYLDQLYQGTNPPKVGKSAVKPDASSSAPSTTALSPTQYAAEVAKLSKQLRGRVEGSPEYAALQARALRYRG